MLKVQHALLLSLFFSFSSLLAQPTNTYIQADKDYLQLKEYVLNENFAHAYTLAAELQRRQPQLWQTTASYIKDDVNFFYLLCALKLRQPIARQNAADYIASTAGTSRASELSYYLAHEYFLEADYEQALIYYEQANINSLTNELVGNLKFEKGYSLFNLKRFAEAKPLFNEISQLPNHKYHLAANYYYGFISYADKQYDEALQAFAVVQQDPTYAKVVPYYIAEIYYFTNKKNEALAYGNTVLSNQPGSYYDNELRLLMGQIYFEQKKFTEALPLLQGYVNGRDKVSKEVLYELSYANYEAGNYPQAIEGFKALSNQLDSMGQNSMYLLGDLYLQTGDKANARNAFQFGAKNSSNAAQQKVSLFNYAKLSYELGYQDVALKEMQAYLNQFPRSEYDVEAKEILVDLLARTSNYRDALALYNSFEKPTANMQKVLPRLQYGRAVELYNDQELVQSASLFNQAVQNKQAANLAAYSKFWLGEIAYREQKYSEAIQWMNQFLSAALPAQEEANAIHANYTIGYARLYRDDAVGAATAFETVLSKANPSTTTYADAQTRLADAYYLQKNYSKAQQLYDKTIAAADAQADYAYYQKALITGIKTPAGKIAMLTQMEQLYPASGMLQDANVQIANTYIAEEKFSAAIPFLNKVISSNSEGLKPAAYLALGLAYYNANDDTKALDALKMVLQIYPQSTEADAAVNTIKDIYIENGNTTEFVALMNASGRAVQVSEADSLAYTAAMVKVNNNDCAGTISIFEKYLQAYPAGNYVVDAHYHVAECYAEAKDYTGALKYYEAITAKGLSGYFEKSVFEAARIYYFQQKNYARAKEYFELLRKNSVNRDYQLEALRGLVRSNYYLNNYTGANEAATALISTKGINADDRTVGYLVLGKTQQLENNCTEAIKSFTQAAAANKANWGAQARYEMAVCQFSMGKYSLAEKAALSTIKETGSYDEWVTRSYILLGDIFMHQKDYFNAKATYESVAKNAAIPELKTEASAKLQAAINAEGLDSKIQN